MVSITQEKHPAMFRMVNACPVGQKYYGLAQSAVNAVTIANQSSWEKEYKVLLEQVHQLYLMPNDMKCILALFEANHFFRQPGLKARVPLEDVVSYMNDHCTENQIVIVEMHRYGGSREFAAVVPANYTKYCVSPNTGSRYYACGFRHILNAYVSDIWVRWDDGLDHSPVKRRKRKTASKEINRKIPADHDTFHFCQKNPKEFTGDCVIRAISSACNISWDDAMDRIAKSSGYTNTTVNTSPVYTKFLKQEKFERRSPLTKDGRKLTGKEFCRELDKILLCGEAVFAYIGKHHVAAVLPFAEDGITHYKVVDSWDSTNEYVGEYWIKEPTRQEGFMTVENIMLVGTYITHPLFGRGKVQSVHRSGWVAINFPKGGFRVLDCRWVKHNCTIEEVLNK